MSSQSNQTRRTRRADENAPPMTRTRSAVTTATTATNQAKALADASSRATTAKTSTKPAASSIPVMKRATSSTAVTKGTSGTASRSALGEVTNAKSKLGAKGKEVSKEGKSDKASGVERKPLASTVGTSQSQPETRRAATARNALDAKLVETVKPATKRKTTATSTTSSRPLVDRSRSNTASTSTVASTSTSRTKIGSKPLLDKAFNLKEEKEQAEPARKKRKTSSPVPPAVVDDLVDEANYDEDGTEILLSSGGRAVSLKSPKRVRAAKDEGWEDLDAEDEGDPNMVSEYVVDAFNYMMKLEATTMADPTYMDSQAELQWKMRTILMDWLIEVHSKFRLLPETLFIAINLIDRFLSARVISLVKFQLVGLTALFIAAKYEEVICPSITHFLHMTDGGYGVEEIIKAERYMLNTISFDMSYPNPLHFLRRISKADGYDIQARTVGKFLIEISAVEHKLIAYPPSLLAAASMWLARLCLERGDWTPNLIHYSGYAVEELIEPAQTMMDYLLDPELDTSSSFYKKYASKKHMKASCFMHTWATTRWPAGEEPEVAGVEAYIEAGIEPPKWRLERGSSKEL